MMDALEQTGYKNTTPNVPVFPVQLEEFGDYLRKLDRSEASVKRSVRNVRTALDTLPLVRQDYTLDGLTEEDFVGLKEKLNGYSDNECRAILNNLGRYLEFLGYNNPYYEAIGIRKRARYWSEGLEGEFLFGDELEKYAQYLRDTGCSEDWIRTKSNMITKCCSVLRKQKRVFSLEDIRPSHLDFLYSLMDNLPHRHATNYVSSLNDFVRFSIGNDPLQDYKDSAHLRSLPDNPQTRKFREELAAYLDDHRERGTCENSIRNFSWDITKVYRRLTEIHGPIYPGDVDFHKMRSLRNAFPDRQQTVQSNLRTFGDFVEFNHGFNPYREAKMRFTYEPTERTFIGNSEFRSMNGGADITGRLILALGSTMGLRRSEIADISLADIHGDMIIINGKGHGDYGKRSEAYIPDRTKKILEEYLEYRKTLIGETDRSEGKLLLRNSKKKGTPMDFNSVGYAVKKLARNADVNASCHTLRRLFCTNLAEDNPLEVVKASMRHSFVSTTVDHYLTARPSQKRNAADSIADKLYA